MREKGPGYIPENVGQMREIGRYVQDAKDVKQFLDIANMLEKNHPALFNALRNSVALDWLKNNGDSAFRQDFTGEMDEHGWLVNQPGVHKPTHVTGYDIGDSYTQITVRSVEKFKEQYPEKYASLPASQDISQKKEQVESVSNYDTLRTASSWTSEEWLGHHRELRELPYLREYEGEKDLYMSFGSARYRAMKDLGVEQVSSRVAGARFEEVPTELIVRAPSMRDWSHSYHDPRNPDEPNAVVEIGKKMARLYQESLVAGNAQTTQEGHFDKRIIDEIYKKDRHHGVNLEKIEGPRGPIYFVEDGSHRVAAAKLVALDHVFGFVGYQKDESNSDEVWFQTLARLDSTERTQFLAFYHDIYPQTAEQATEEKKQLDVVVQEREQRIEKKKKEIIQFVSSANTLQELITFLGSVSPDDFPELKYQEDSIRNAEKKFAATRANPLFSDDDDAFIAFRLGVSWDYGLDKKVGEILSQQTAEGVSEGLSRELDTFDAVFADTQSFYETHIKEDRVLSQEFEQIKHEVALARLVEFFNKDSDSIWQKHEQKMNDRGFLYKKDGTSSSTHVTDYDTGHRSHDHMLVDAIKKFRSKHAELT